MSVLRRISYWAAITLLVYMPFHIFLAQSLSLLTGGLDAWKVGKDVFLALAALFTICLVWQQRVGNRRFNLFVGLGAMYFALHLLLWAINPGIYQESAILGTIYNMRLPAFLVLGYGAMLLNPSKFVFSSVIKVVVGVSTLVAFLGVLQYFLPKDLLSHLGYSLERGVRPAFFIDDNPDLPRIMSTLREPNALGAYLILPFTALSWLFLWTKNNSRRLVIGGAWVLHLVAIFLTFSRSAWIGVILALVLVSWWAFKDHIVGSVRRYWPVAAGILVVMVVSTLLLRNTLFFQQYVIHSNPQEQVADLDSNDYHILLTKQGLVGVVDQPIGHGPGTAGLASIQNPKGSLLTENYYLQIGYELGVVGLGMFIAINVYLYKLLRRQGDHIVVMLLASFWAYVVTNMLLHTWSNEAVAVQWWLLAGMAMGPIAASTKSRP